MEHTSGTADKSDLKSETLLTEHQVQNADSYLHSI